MNNDVKPGDKIFHKVYGWGTVISEGHSIEIDFGENGNKKLLYRWVVKNCEIIRKDEEEIDFDELNDSAYINVNVLGSGEAMRNFVQKEKIEEIMSKFSRFKLSESSFHELVKFFMFKANYQQGHKTALRYNLLIECETPSEAKRLINTIVMCLKEIHALPKTAVVETEDSVAEKMPSKFPLDCSLMAVYRCTGLEKDTVAIVSSGIRADLQLKRKNKNIVWDTIRRVADIEPDCTIIAAGDKEFIDYIRESDEMYYRFFAHRIFMRPMTLDEITEAVYKGIRAESLTTDQAFDEGIKRYIQIVYPKADLKESNFVNDLVNRILVSYYQEPTGGTITENCVPFYRKPRSFEEISEDLNQLVGLKSVKQQFHQIYKMSLDPMNRNKQRIHFAFVGNPGTGKTTVAALTAEMLYSMGLIRKNKIVTVAPADIISVYKGESGQLMQEKINEARGGVLFIDEAYFLTSKVSDTGSQQKQCIDVLIQEMEKNANDLSVIFAGYQNEIDELMKSNPGLASRVPYRFVFEDYSDEELLQIFLELAEHDGMKLAKNAYEVMAERIALAKTEENFGNARTISNIYQQVKAVWLEQEREDRTIEASDIQATMPILLHDNLNDMIGLEDVKRELNVFESRIKYIKYLLDKGISIPAPNLHMLFTGNPGTGKTTVAKKIADCLYHIGVLKTNKLVVAERKDLVSSHVGETALKTNKIIQKAMNGVLFIDEAYSLYRGKNSGDFGEEAIATLITAMEEYKGKLVVIFAGYQDEMRLFQSANPGISSRIGFTFHFPDYSPEELTMIFCSKMTKNGFLIEKSALKQIYKIMEYFSTMDNFGNGRFVDKVIDMTVNNRSLRSYRRRYNDIKMRDIPEIKDLIRVSPDRRRLWTDEEQSDELRRRIAVHEAGHAIVSILLDSHRKITTVSINADAGSMGKAIMENTGDSITESMIKANLATLFGGRNAERIVFGEHSTGCVADYKEAKQLASRMVNDLAMGEIGVSSETDFLVEADRKATEILSAHKEELMKIAELLFEKGTLTGKEIRGLLLYSE